MIRLHYDDPRLLTFDAHVAAHATHEGRPSILLDRSAFYPESGGQMSDRGTISGKKVIDVQLDDAGQVHHVIEGELPEIGARIDGNIDGVRRREHMALHTGQHALSRALLDELRAVTVSSRLGESACTIDVDRDGLSLSAVRAAEERVNALIDEDREVRQFFPTDAELDRLELRKAPKNEGPIRVVAIEGFDVTPCGGTHCEHTAQIELVRIDSVERYKGGTRVTFVAGPRARRMLAAESEALRAMSASMKCAIAEVAPQLDKLRSKLDEAREEAGALRAQLAGAWADRLKSEDRIIAVVEGADATMLKAMAARLEGAKLIALAAPSAGGTDVVIVRGTDTTISAGDLLKKIAAACGGRGGGRPDSAQGRLPADVDFVALVRAAL
jgi:alanyl-tRNA synthetase